MNTNLAHQTSRIARFSGAANGIFWEIVAMALVLTVMIFSVTAITLYVMVCSVHKSIVPSSGLSAEEAGHPHENLID